ncbi:MAG: response regulator transcription factor [Saprospiraceae bacterium]|nr:response regulator transcription factor [Saprospiraceae bacterium]
MRFLNVLVADDHPIFVEGLQAVLSNSDGKFVYKINGVARTGNQITQLLHESKADLLLLDLNLPETDGLKILPAVKKDSSATRVLVVTMFDDPRIIKAAFRAGADGYILKSGSKDELFRAIEEVIDGHTYLGNGVALIENRFGNGTDTISPDKRFARKYGLTRREIEVMRYIGQALNNKDIAKKLYISDQTVSVHRKNIMRKLGVNNTASLIKIAFENNLV